MTICVKCACQYMMYIDQLSLLMGAGHNPSCGHIHRDTTFGLSDDMHSSNTSPPSQFQRVLLGFNNADTIKQHAAFKIICRNFISRSCAALHSAHHLYSWNRDGAVGYARGRAMYWQAVQICAQYFFRKSGQMQMRCFIQFSTNNLLTYTATWRTWCIFLSLFGCTLAGLCVHCCGGNVVLQ